MRSHPTAACNYLICQASPVFGNALVGAAPNPARSPRQEFIRVALVRLGALEQRKCLFLRFHGHRPRCLLRVVVGQEASTGLSRDFSLGVEKNAFL